MRSVCENHSCGYPHVNDLLVIVWVVHFHWRNFPEIKSGIWTLKLRFKCEKGPIARACPTWCALLWIGSTQYFGTQIARKKVFASSHSSCILRFCSQLSLPSYLVRATEICIAIHFLLWIMRESSFCIHVMIGVWFVSQSTCQLLLLIAHTIISVLLLFQ